jgi:hypothetical protein
MITLPRILGKRKIDTNDGFQHNLEVVDKPSIDYIVDIMARYNGVALSSNDPDIKFVTNSELKKQLTRVTL